MLPAAAARAGKQVVCTFSSDLIGESVPHLPCGRSSGNGNQSAMGHSR